MRDLINRYQLQPWYVRLWRRRYYLPVPFKTFRVWFKNRGRVEDDGFTYPFGLCWSLEIGLAQSKMEYYWTWDEVKIRRAEKNERRKKNTIN